MEETNRTEVVPYPKRFVTVLVVALILAVGELVFRVASDTLSPSRAQISAIAIPALTLTLALTQVTWAVRGLIRERRAEARTPKPNAGIS